MRAFGRVWRRIYGERGNDGREVGRIEPDLETDAVGSWNLYGTCGMEMDEPIRRAFPFIVLYGGGARRNRTDDLFNAIVGIAWFR